MDYLEREIEYSNLLHELEIGGEEHLKAILKDPSIYLKNAEELQARISSDKFLSAEDKEKMLRKVSLYLEKVKPNQKGEGINLNYILALLAGFLLDRMMKDSGAGSDEFIALRDELGKYLR